jgi:hypothetical protein
VGRAAEQERVDVGNGPSGVPVAAFVPESAPEAAPVPVAPTGGVAVPTFVAPPAEDEDLRLFE